MVSPVTKHWIVSAAAEGETEHPSYIEASNAARELANNNPGEIYTIYEAKNYAVTDITNVRVRPVLQPVPPLAP